MTDWDPEGLRLPVKLDATSNGEFAPIPLSREFVGWAKLAKPKLRLQDDISIKIYSAHCVSSIAFAPWMKREIHIQ